MYADGLQSEDPVSNSLSGAEIGKLCEFDKGEVALHVCHLL